MVKLGKRRWRWPRIVAAVVGGLLVVCGWYVLVVGLLSSRSTDTPALSGPYKVGRTSFEWADSSRTDPLDAEHGPRRLAVWLWYPAPGSAQGKALTYTPGLWSRLAFGKPVSWFESDFSRIKIHAISGAPVAGGPFPVVVLEPGMGFSAPQYTVLAESLASRGYIVAGLTPTYSANVTVLGGQVVGRNAQGNPPELGAHTGTAQQTGDRLATEWAADAHFVADQVTTLGTTGQFAGKVGSKVTYVGHSFGGASSLEACRTDQRCAGAVDLDGTQFGAVVGKGLQAPFLMLGSEDSCITGTCGPVGHDAGGEVETAAMLLKASTSQRWLVTVSGAHHLNFTDYSTYFVAPPLRGLLGLGSINGKRLLAIQDDYVATFLDHVTRGTTASGLDALPDKYPEAKVRGPK
ncbi:alpha/beta hydrolase family protein [Kribbella sp. NPDC048928]|uniref:alpha/beta hydrolase family protein n=1 Tax=Kribbella sp. NPDC048928 TaxID=3364111 RepID=UPI003722C9A3